MGKQASKRVRIKRSIKSSSRVLMITSKRRMLVFLYPTHIVLESVKLVFFFYIYLDNQQGALLIVGGGGRRERRG